MRTESIDARLKNIQELFSSSNSRESILGRGGIYAIPEYQRAYNWRSDEQCDKLWQDVEAFIENKKDSSYFFGSVILNKDREDGLLIIDGQQRMTTFILLLKALLLQIDKVLNAMTVDEESKALKEALENRRKSILGCLYDIDEDDVFLVVEGKKPLKELDIKYENRSMNEQYATDVEAILWGKTYEEIECAVTRIKYKKGDNSRTTFFRNFKFFMEKLEAYDSTQLNTFAKTLLNDCNVIAVISYQKEEAIEIFNSLNSTGMPLADADIIAAELYSNYKEDKAEFKDRWSEIMANIHVLDEWGIVTIDDILNQYMYILKADKSQALSGKTDMAITGVRRYFTSINSKALKDPAKFMEDFNSIIDIWQDGETADQHEEAVKELYNLKQILFGLNGNFKFFYATYMFYNKDKPNTEKVQFTLELLKLFALLSISGYGYSSSRFKTFLLNLNMDIGAGMSTQELVQKIHAHIQSSFSKENIQTLIRDSEPSKGLVYLNEYLFAKETQKSLDFSTQNIEIEHIMPRSGKNIAAIRADAGMDKDTFTQYVNKIGNKILLEKPINGPISNRWFRMKKQALEKDAVCYADSTFPIAQTLTAYPKDTWRKEDIDQASEKAARRIAEFIFD